LSGPPVSLTWFKGRGFSLIFFRLSRWAGFSFWADACTCGITQDNKQTMRIIVFTRSPAKYCFVTFNIVDLAIRLCTLERTHAFKVREALATAVSETVQPKPLDEVTP